MCRTLKKKLAEFVTFKNVVSDTTDGGAVIGKVGKLLNIIQHICLAHKNSFSCHQSIACGSQVAENKF